MKIVLLLALFASTAYASQESVTMNLAIAKAHYEHEKVVCQKKPKAEAIACRKALDAEYQRIVQDIQVNEKVKP